jgi:hypothetical protein
MATNQRNMKVRICPHCGTKGSGSSMTMYHFDNCFKVKPQQKLSYTGYHKWIKCRYGKAKEYECCHCGKTAHDWAIKKDKEYSKNIDDYISLCRSCHKKYDLTEEVLSNLTKGNQGKNKGRKYVSS